MPQLERHLGPRGPQSLEARTTHLRVAMLTHTGRQRPTNEDACVVCDLGLGAASFAHADTRLAVGPRGVLLAVSDGMGGALDGEIASALVVSRLADTLVAAPAREDAVVMLTEAVQEANRSVRAASHAAGQHGRSRMGATLTATLVRDGHAYLAQVGDSRAYLLRAGTLTMLTHDQTMVQSLCDAGLLSAEAAGQSPMRNVLLQAVGHARRLDVALAALELRERDCLLLCSDGLTTHLTDDEIRDIMLSSSKLDLTASRLVRVANERGGHDNLTVLLAGVGGGSLPPPRMDEQVDDTLETLARFAPPSPWREH